MDKPRGILVFGLNGSGKTTLGRELARVMGFKHLDIEDYCFRESDIPYTDSRPREEWVALMHADIEKYRSFVASSVKWNWCDDIKSMFVLAIYLSVPVEIRMKRIYQRAFDKFGKRVLEGGDMYEQQKEFHDFAASRSNSAIEEWAKTLACPVLQIDATRDYQESVAEIARLYGEILQH